MSLLNAGGLVHPLEKEMLRFRKIGCGIIEVTDSMLFTHKIGAQTGTGS